MHVLIISQVGVSEGSPSGGINSAKCSSCVFRVFLSFCFYTCLFVCLANGYPCHKFQSLVNKLNILVFLFSESASGSTASDNRIYCKEANTSCSFPSADLLLCFAMRDPIKGVFQFQVLSQASEKLQPRRGPHLSPSCTSNCHT